MKVELSYKEIKELERKYNKFKNKIKRAALTMGGVALISFGLISSSAAEKIEKPSQNEILLENIITVAMEVKKSYEQINQLAADEEETLEETSELSKNSENSPNPLKEFKLFEFKQFAQNDTDMENDLDMEAVLQEIKRDFYEDEYQQSEQRSIKKEAQRPGKAKSVHHAEDNMDYYELLLSSEKLSDFEFNTMNFDLNLERLQKTKPLVIKKIDEILENSELSEIDRLWMKSFKRNLDNFYKILREHPQKIVSEYGGYQNFLNSFINALSKKVEEVYKAHEQLKNDPDDIIGLNKDDGDFSANNIIVDEIYIRDYNRLLLTEEDSMENIEEHGGESHMIQKKSPKVPEGFNEIYKTLSKISLYLDTGLPENLSQKREKEWEKGKSFDDVIKPLVDRFKEVSKQASKIFEENVEIKRTDDFLNQDM